MAIRLVVGLGNPGARYARNRHNIGWRVLDELARRRGLVFGAGTPAWCAADDPAGDLVLLKPLTWMNRSGEALVDWSRHTGVALTGALPGEAASGEEAPPSASAAVRPLVVCDDLALPLGAVRLRIRGSSGGQNGLASVIGHLGGEDFPRLRLGIGPAGEPVPAHLWPDYVLADFGADEEEAVAGIVAHAADAVECCLELGAEAAGSRFNRRGPAAPPAP